MSELRYVMLQLRGCFNFRSNLSTLWVRGHSRYAALDGIRAMSILLVIFFHALMSVGRKMSREEFQLFLEDLPWFMRWLMQGDKGVETFFVLSGFLIGCMLLKEGARSGGQINYKQFYWRRFLRLSPAYWILLLMILIAPLEIDKMNLWVYLFYFQNFLPADQLLAGWAWSLAVEEQFYLLLPLMFTLFFFKTRHKLLMLILLLAASFPIRYFLLISNPEFLSQNYVDLMHDQEFFVVIYDNLYSRYGALASGVIAAYLHCHHADKLTRFFESKATIANVLHVLAIVTFISLMVLPVHNWQGESYSTLVTIFHTASRNAIAMSMAYIALACIYGVGFSRWVRALFAWRIWLVVSQMAYGLYLFHPILTLVAEETIRHNMVNGETYTLYHLLAIAFLTTFISMIFCLFSYTLVEKPFMNLRELKMRQDVPVVDAEPVAGGLK